MLLFLLVLLPAVASARVLDQHIVGGSIAADGAWPSQLSLRGLVGSHSCGAVLVGALKAVTAAHCVGGSAVTYSILAGTNQHECNDTCVGIETRRITSVTRHPEFIDNGSVGYPNDIATISWTIPLLPSAGKIQYANLATGTDQVGRNCFITGWGRRQAIGTLNADLQEAKVDVLTTDECITYWPTQVTDTQVCVLDKTNNAVAACNGDFGGPLYCQMNLGRWELVGITSWGGNQCSASMPTVSARISSYAQWINDN